MKVVKPLQLVLFSLGGGLLLRISQQIFGVSEPCTLLPTPYILDPKPSTLHPPLYNLRFSPYALHHTPHTLRPTSYTIHPTPYTLHPTPDTLHPITYILHHTLHTPHPKACDPDPQLQTTPNRSASTQDQHEIAKRSQFKGNCSAEMWSGSEEGSYVRLIDCCITQL